MSSICELQLPVAVWPGGGYLELGQPDDSALAGNEAQAPPQSSRGRTPGSKPHAIALATPGPDVCFRDSAPALVSQEKGKHIGSWPAPQDLFLLGVGG